MAGLFVDNSEQNVKLRISVSKSKVMVFECKKGSQTVHLVETNIVITIHLVFMPILNMKLKTVDCKTNEG